MSRAPEIIKQLRIDLCLDQTQLAKELNCSKSSICNYEHGSQFPRFGVIRKMMELAAKHKIKLKPGDFFNADEISKE